MKQTKRSLCPQLCKDCPVMNYCKECYDCATRQADKIFNFFGVCGYAKPNECFCLQKFQVKPINREYCSLRGIVLRMEKANAVGKDNQS